MKRYLIVNADDFGMCRAANEAVFDLFRRGCLKSSTVMIPCPAAEDAARFAAENPQYAIGVHLTTTSEWDTYKWGPLTGAKSLKEETGFMTHHAADAESRADLKELEAELKAQIEQARAWGMEPSHLDNHMGSLYGHNTGRFEVLELTLRICGEYGKAFRLFTDVHELVPFPGMTMEMQSQLLGIIKPWAQKYGVPMPNYLLMPNWTDDLRTSYEHYREEILKIWVNIPEGITETFVHPCVEDDEMKTIIRKWRDRVWEYQLMGDPYTHQYLKDHGVELISYRDLVEIRKNEFPAHKA